MDNTNNSEKTINRLRRAQELGIKVSAVCREAGIGEFRVRALLSTTHYVINGAPRKPGQLKESELASINKALDSIKAEL